MKVKHIGIGSPQQDDQAGWMMIDALEKIPALANSCELLKLDRPGMRLIEEISEQEQVVIYDAAFGIEPGQIKCIESIEQYKKFHSLSSHGLGVVESLAMADVLGLLPQALMLVAIGVANPKIINLAINQYINDERYLKNQDNSHVL